MSSAKKTPSRGKGKGKGKGKAPEMSDTEMCTAFVQHLGTKLASEGRNLEVGVPPSSADTWRSRPASGPHDWLAATPEYCDPGA